MTRHIAFHCLLLLLSGSFGFADLTYSTNFTGDEGFTRGPIDKSKQEAMPVFSEVGKVIGGLYFPASQGPDFGVLRRNPTSGGARAIHTKGEGASYIAGATWTTRMRFTFEGAPAGLSNKKDALMLGGIGFTNSKSKVADLIYAGIQKNPTQDQNYQFYVFGNGGGGFFAQNLSYDAVGDLAGNPDDLSDPLEVQITLTKASRAGVFSFVASLVNLEQGSTLATLKGELTMPALNRADLYAYVSSGSVREADNFDLFNLHAFSYEAKD
jgi:hypothetical protein